jgi:hypothetical protein
MLIVFGGLLVTRFRRQWPQAGGGRTQADRFAFPAKAGIHFRHGYRLSPV